MVMPIARNCQSDRAHFTCHFGLFLFLVIPTERSEWRNLRESAIVSCDNTARVEKNCLDLRVYDVGSSSLIYLIDHKYEIISLANYCPITNGFCGIWALAVPHLIRRNGYGTWACNYIMGCNYNNRLRSILLDWDEKH